MDVMCAPKILRGRRPGFTLLELLVVIVIIGLLAAYVGPKCFSQLGKSEVTVARAQIVAFAKSLDTFRLDVGRYPTTEKGLNALMIAPPAAASKWNGPYMKKSLPLDLWGHAYQYRARGAKGDYEIVSLGRDGQPGGQRRGCRHQLSVDFLTFRSRLCNSRYARSLPT